jgi:hypothetical protein
MTQVFLSLSGNQRVNVNCICWIDEATNTIELDNGKKKTVTEEDMVKICLTLKKKHTLITPLVAILLIIVASLTTYIATPAPEPTELAYEVQQCLAQQED